MRRLPALSDEEKEFLIKNFPEHGLSFCAKSLKRSEYFIRQCRKLLKLRSKKSSFDASKNVNINQFLTINSKHVAYYLGLLWADGHLRKDSSKIIIEIIEQDFKSLSKVFESIGKFLISFKRKRKDTHQNTVTISTHNFLLHNFLNENDYSIKSDTSPSLILNKIPIQLRKYFFRGWFDGDGNCNVRKEGRYRFTIAGTYEQDWKDFVGLLDILDIKYKLKKTVSKIGHKSSIVYCENMDGFKKFFGYIYDGYEIDKIGLLRKFNCYKEGLDQMDRHKGKKRNYCKSLGFL